MKIRLATSNDMNDINCLFKEVIKDLKENKKIDMLWGDIYPFCEFEADISNNNMYILEDKGKIIGSFSITDEDDPDYKNIDWNFKDNKHIYLNRLVVLPSEQGNGYARKMLEYIENYAKENNFQVIRLTVYNENANAIKLYEKYGFKKVTKGDWKLEDKTFIGYEKKLRP